MQCNICHSEMKHFTESSKSVFYRCPKCSFCVGQRKDGIKDFSYEEYETFDAGEGTFDDKVIEAKYILQTKFNLINCVPNSFLDIGCSEGVFVEAYRQLYQGGRCAGIEVSKSKIERAKEKNLDVGTYGEIHEKYNFVLLRHVIEHMEKSREFYENIMDQYVCAGGIVHRNS